MASVAQGRNGGSDASDPGVDRTPSAQRTLAAAVHSAGGLRIGTAVLLGDALLAVAFAGGLAGAVAVVAAGTGALALVGWLVLAAVAACSRGAGAVFAVAAAAAATGKAKQELRDGLVRTALTRPQQPPSADSTAGSLMQLVVDDVEAFDAYLSRYVPARRAAVAAPLLLLGAAAVASPIAAGILAATLLPFFALMMFTGTASAAESRRQFAALARLSGIFADRLRALPAVLAFRAEQRETERLARVASEVARGTMKVLRLAFLSSAVLEFFAALCVALIAVYAGFNLLGLLPFGVPERLDLGRAFFVLALAPEFYVPMRRLAAAYHDRQAAQTAAERLVVFQGPPHDAGVVGAVASAAPLASFVGPPRLRFENVSIRYSGDARIAVRDLSFDLHGGRTLALLGPSGSGKTTVLRALLGLAPVMTGGIRLGSALLGAGHSIATYTAWIGQMPLIVSGTVRDNLLLAAPGTSEAALAQATAVAGLAPMLARRAGGLDAMIDARGSGLSGGERRRIALVRALLKQAPIWLLDEPTSHLDEAAEVELIACIAGARHGRTTIIATHSERLAAIADVVIRLGDSG